MKQEEKGREGGKKTTRQTHSSIDDTQNDENDAGSNKGTGGGRGPGFKEKSIAEGEVEPPVTKEGRGNRGELGVWLGRERQPASQREKQ